MLCDESAIMLSIATDYEVVVIKSSASVTHFNLEGHNFYSFAFDYLWFSFFYVSFLRFISRKIGDDSYK